MRNAYELFPIDDFLYLMFGKRSKRFSERRLAVINGFRSIMMGEPSPRAGNYGRMHFLAMPINRVIQGITTIAEGGNGTVSGAHVTERPKALVVAKIPLNINGSDPVTFEFLNGAALNGLRDRMPNFALSYALFWTTAAFTGDDHRVEALGEARGTRVPSRFNLNTMARLYTESPERMTIDEFEAFEQFLYMTRMNADERAYIESHMSLKDVKTWGPPIVEMIRRLHISSVEKHALEYFVMRKLPARMQGPLAARVPRSVSVRDVPMLLQEHVQGNPLTNFLDTCTTGGFLCHLAQVCVALQFAQDDPERRLTHYDLHSSNVLMRKFEHCCSDVRADIEHAIMNYRYKSKDYLIPSTGVCTLIDYGRSSITQATRDGYAKRYGMGSAMNARHASNPYWRKAVWLSEYGVEDQFNPVWDFVRLFYTCLARLRLKNPRVFEDDEVQSLSSLVYLEFPDIGQVPVGFTKRTRGQTGRLKKPIDLVHWIMATYAYQNELTYAYEFREPVFKWGEHAECGLTDAMDSIPHNAAHKGSSVRYRVKMWDSYEKVPGMPFYKNWVTPVTPLRPVAAPETRGLGRLQTGVKKRRRMA